MQNKTKIFIPFLEGILNYNCQECGHQCCGKGMITLNDKEKGKLLQKYPYLKYFFFSKTKETYSIIKHPQCWFLNSNGACEIQEKNGYSSKPFICRLHPFYVHRCGDEHIVIPRDCPPLRVGKTNTDISHKLIIENAQESVKLNCVQDEINWPKKRLNLEKKILKESRRFLDSQSYLDFSAYQIALTENIDHTEKIKKKLLEHIALWKSFFGLEKLSIENKELTYELVALTSLLRAENIHLRYMSENIIPFALLSLYFYMLLFIKINETKIYADTYNLILNDIPLGLLLLTENDLSLKNRPTEKKLHYLRMLQKLPDRMQNLILQPLNGKGRETKPEISIPAFAKSWENIKEKAMPVSVIDLYNNIPLQDKFIRSEREGNAALSESCFKAWMKLQKNLPDKIKVTEMFAGLCPMVRGILAIPGIQSRLEVNAVDLASVALDQAKKEIPQLNTFVSSTADTNLIDRIGRGTQHVVLTSASSIGYLNPHEWKTHMRLVSEILVKGGAYFIDIGNWIAMVSKLGRTPQFIHHKTSSGQNYFSTAFILKENTWHGTRTIYTLFANEDFSKIEYTDHLLYLSIPDNYALWKEELGFSRCVSVNTKESNLLDIDKVNDSETGTVICMIK